MRQMLARGLGRVALAICLGTLLPACGLLFDFEPPDGSTLECTAQVRSAAGHVEVVSSLTHPDFVEITTSPDGSTETAALRDFFNCRSGPCPRDCPPGDTIAGAEADFESWLGIRVRERSVVPTSVFEQFDGPWCLVPDTVQCRDAGPIQTGGLTCGLLPSVDRLPVCTSPPPPPPGDPCLEVECGGVVPCEGLEFGSVNVGEASVQTVAVSNCGGTAAPDIALTLSGDVLPDLAFTLRDFRVTRNQCLPDTPEEMLAGEEILTNPIADLANSRCEFDVTFEPSEHGEHGAEIAFRSDLDPRHQVLLRGKGEGGELVFTVPDLPVPTDIPDKLCVDALVGSCTRTRTVRVRNDGPGAVTITGVRLEIGGRNWEIVSPPPPPLPIVLAAGANTAVEVRWCDGPLPVMDDDRLIIDSNAPLAPTFMVELGRDSAGCAPGT